MTAALAITKRLGTHRVPLQDKNNNIAAPGDGRTPESTIAELWIPVKFHQTTEATYD